MKNSGLFIAGLLSLIGGLFACFNPFAASLTVDLLAGWFLIICAVVMLYFAFSSLSGQAKWSEIIIALAYLLLGYFLLAHPLQGLVSLTLLFGIMLLLAGIFRLCVAVKLLHGYIRWIMIASAALSLLLAGLIFANFPQSAAVTLGLIFAIELMSNGISLLFWSSADSV
ncbi:MULTISPECIES: HdeD family acid-resistance protein [Pasteurellaceae]|uniref:HdeD family acid-resistance protein n=1 Tax=Pasteurellaceae TaxID=712 RepID=UPI0035699533